jgi:hypothetical protein
VIERFLGLIFELLILFVVVLFVLGLALGLLREGGAAVGAAAGHVIPRLIADIVVTLLIGIFCVGLAVRVQCALTGHGRRTGRERAARERAVRQQVRRPAEGAPPMNSRRAHLLDPDPAVNDGEEDG